MNKKKDDLEYCCTSFKHIGLSPGEEVRIVEGVKLEMKPAKVTVVREYKAKVLLDMEFVKSLYYSKMPPRHIKIGIAKGSMLCGDVKLQHKKDGIILCGEEVGCFGWV